MAPSKLSHQIEKTMEDLRQTRDEIRLQLHLASMDARTRWNEEFEPAFVEAERVAAEVSDTAFEALQKIAKRVRAFRESMRATQRDSHP